MTDNEIIKAWESEIHLAEYVDSDYCNNIDLYLIKSTLDLINRLQTENGRLKYQVNRLKTYDRRRDIDLHSMLIANARAEAIKEFAERLKKLNRWRAEDIYYIDTLVKEMVGENL